MKIPRFIFYILYLICFLIVPAVLIFTTFNYAEETSAPYALGMSFWVAVVLILYVFKYIIFKNVYTDLSHQINNLKTSLCSETDNTKISLITKKLHTNLILRDIWNMIFPAAVIGLSYYAVSVTQKNLLDLKSILGWCILSWIVGFFFKIIHDLLYKSKVKESLRHD